jgi:hypothetical protein
MLKLLACSLCASASAAEVEAFATYDHTSNIVRGCPRRCEQDESSQEYLGGGVTISAGKRKAWEIDLSHGIKSIDGDRREVGSKFEVRYYPGRK